MYLFIGDRVHCVGGLKTACGNLVPVHRIQRLNSGWQALQGFTHLTTLLFLFFSFFVFVFIFVFLNQVSYSLTWLELVMMKGETGWPGRLEVSEHQDFNTHFFLKTKQNIGLNSGLCAWNFLSKLPPQSLVFHLLRACDRNVIFWWAKAKYLQ